jgi:hypothetical protein
VEQTLPQEIDQRGARLALVRLQMTYDLPINDLLNGVVAGRKSRPLSQQEALSIGLTAINASHADKAIEWFTATFKHRQEPNVADHQLYHAIAKAHAAVCDALRWNN